MTLNRLLNITDRPLWMHNLQVRRNNLKGVNTNLHGVQWILQADELMDELMEIINEVDDKLYRLLEELDERQVNLQFELGERR
jgi:hypothetical protein